MRTWLRIVTIASLLLGAAGAASARGTVLKIEGDAIYIDLGTADGIDAGSKLRLLHVITATHPVSKKKVRDTFELGILEVVRAGKHMCIAAADPELQKRVTVGDEIELVGAPRTVVDPWEEATKPRRPPDQPVEEEEDPEDDVEKQREAAARKRAAAVAKVKAEEAAREAWRRTLGKPPAERIVIWQAYLEEFPGSPHAATVKEEIANLRAQLQAEAALAAEAEEAQETRQDGGPLVQLGPMNDVVLAGPLAYTPPARVYEGASVELAFLVVKPQSVQAGWIHYRHAGEDTYRRAQLAPVGDSYLTVRIPGDAVKAPDVYYFVEVIEAGVEEPQAVIGTSDAPEKVRVDASVEEPPRDIDGRSRVTLFVDYVDFDGFSSDFDQYLQAEADFMYRFRRPIYAMRIGFATLAGKGGPKDVIDDDPGGNCRIDPGNAETYACRRVAFTYAYTELEIRLSDIVHLMVRPMYGGGYRTSRQDGEPAYEDFTGSMGLRTRLRLGRELETNLVIGLGLTEGFGTMFEAAFTWDVIRRWPIVLSAQVTDQPVAEDFGLRLVADVGFRGASWVYPSLRLAYQARDIDHAGVSGGMAVNFDW